MRRSNFLRFFLTITVLLFATAIPARAEKRVALVIGNSTYLHAPKLPNTVNDAIAVTILLRSLGFEVVETGGDLGINEMRRAIRDFSNTARDSEIAVVFYAGHGMEVDGSNFLVPVDARLERDIDVEDETVSLERMLRVLEPAKRLRLIILDACRDNPFARTMSRTIASRAVGRGLARVEPATSDTLIAFSAKAGSIASDGGNFHSPFTAALLKHLATPGLDVRIAFGRVRDEVIQTTEGRQEPFVYGSLGGSVIALAPLTHDERIDIRPIDHNDLAARDYESALKIGTKDAWDAFLAAHPKGVYADLARIQRARLTALVPTAPPQLVEPAKPVNPSVGSPSKKTKSAAVVPTAPPKLVEPAKPVKPSLESPTKKINRQQKVTHTRTAQLNTKPVTVTV
jgi:hypothetical protein